jgi:hypothetical protein
MKPNLEVLNEIVRGAMERHTGTYICLALWYEDPTNQYSCAQVTSGHGDDNSFLEALSSQIEMRTFKIGRKPDLLVDIANFPEVQIVSVSDDGANYDIYTSRDPELETDVA